MTSEASLDAHAFITRIDEAIEAHNQWTPRVLRCAVLHKAPDAEVFSAEAHRQCAFGHWLDTAQEDFDALRPGNAAQVAEVHRAMHDAIRTICTQAEAGKPSSESDLEAFESSLAALNRLLADMKARVLSTIGHSNPLTRLLVQEGLVEDFERAKADAARRQDSLFVALVEVDHFKNINDQYGNLVGDLAINTSASALRQVVRRNEPVYRFGGEEFLILLRCENRECAGNALRRFLEAIGESEISLARGSTLNLTATIGACQVTGDDDLATAITRADGALHEGKQAGHNRYVIA